MSSRPTPRIAPSAFALACALSAAPTVAQTANCSAPDLKPVADGWLPTKIGLVLAEKRCEGREFIKNVFSKQEDPDNITPVDVLEASRPKLDPQQQRVRDEFLAREKIKLREQSAYSDHMRANMANEAVTAANERETELRNAGVEIKYPFQKYPDGSSYYLVPGENPNDPPKIVWAGVPPKEAKPNFTGEGVTLSTQGIEAGTFKDGQLEGAGEEVEGNGTWRAGQFDNGQLDGPGVEVDRSPDGRTYMVTGEFEDDSPDGQVTVTYPGGSQRKQLWDDGKLLTQGAVSAPGQPVADAPAFKPSQAMVAYEATESWEMVPQKPGGTLDGTFETNGQPTGELIRRYPDGTSQRELWEGGKIIGRGALSRPGGVPPPINKMFRQQLPPRATWKPAIVRAAPPRVAPRISSSGYSSVCARNYSKIQSLVYARGGVDYREAKRINNAYFQIWGPCRSYDPAMEKEYQDIAQFAGQLGPDQYVPSNEPFFSEVNKAISDPNYSADLGPVKGQPVGGSGSGVSSNAPPASGPAQDGPAPGTSVGPVTIATPVLPPSFQQKYSGTGLSPDTISQQMDSDPQLRSIDAQLQNTREIVTKLRLLIAQLEARIIIMRQSQDFPDAHKLIQGMIEARKAAILQCQSFSINPGLCTTPM